MITAADVTIDLDAKLVTRDGIAVRLTSTEYRPLETLATNAGRLCTTASLERVWGPATAMSPSTFGSTWPTCARSSTTWRPRSCC